MNDAPFGSNIAGDFLLAMLDDTGRCSNRTFGDFTNQDSSSLEHLNIRCFPISLY